MQKFLDVIVSAWLWFIVLMGMLYLAVVSFTMDIFVRDKEKVKKWFMMRMNKFCHFFMFNIPLSKYIVENLTGEEDPFAKPRVVVANHQSLLDILSILAVSKNVCVVAKDWVWQNALIRNVLKYSDSMRSDRLADGTYAEHIQAMIDKGRSILIFPEGGRSRDGKIHRFRAGAFTMAKQYKLDILPVVLDGNFEFLTPEKKVVSRYDRKMTILPVYKYEQVDDELSHLKAIKEVRETMVKTLGK